MANITSIQISTETRERLQAYGKKEETYDELINRILNERKQKEVKKDDNF